MFYEKFTPPASLATSIMQLTRTPSQQGTTTTEVPVIFNVLGKAVNSAVKISAPTTQVVNTDDSFLIKRVKSPEVNPTQGPTQTTATQGQQNPTVKKDPMSQITPIAIGASINPAEQIPTFNPINKANLNPLQQIPTTVTPSAVINPVQQIPVNENVTVARANKPTITTVPSVTKYVTAPSGLNVNMGAGTIAEVVEKEKQDEEKDGIKYKNKKQVIEGLVFFTKKYTRIYFIIFLFIIVILLTIFDKQILKFIKSFNKVRRR